ncbi:MAG: outer membrane protein assembly factor BamD [Bacteroidota bacterium]
MKGKYLFFCVIVLLVLGSCSKFRKLQKKGDWKEKYEAAIKYYERGGKKDYYKATVLLEDILPIIRGTEYAEKAEFVYAYSYFRQGQHILSAHYFQNFSRTFSRSEFAEEATFMYAYSLYLDSPIHSLDQSSTYEAIEAMQLFLNRYPSSTFREQGNGIIDDLQEKLEKKSYENSKQYFELGQYKSAIVAFDNFRNQFPDSDYVEEMVYLKIDAQFKLAVNSIFSKKRERLLEAIELYEEYLDDFPDGAYLKRAERIYADSQNELVKLQRQEITNSNF